MVRISMVNPSDEFAYIALENVMIEFGFCCNLPCVFDGNSTLYVLHLNKEQALSDISEVIKNSDVSNEVDAECLTVTEYPDQWWDATCKELRV